MSWTNLKAAIAAAIKTNNNQEITGAILQNILNSIVNSVGANATFAGVAIPSTSPGTPDGPVFWLAGQAGQYSNFNNTTVPGGTLGVFVFDGSTWTFSIVAEMTSSALVGYYTCGASQNKASETIKTVDNAYDYTLPANGDSMKIKMYQANTATGTVKLQFGNTAAKDLYYNGLAVSPTNTWDAGETISVYYDGTNYQASNSQGSGGKAEKISYDNSQNWISSDNVQGALDELAETTGEDTNNQADLDIVDGFGNVLVRFENGEVQTKEFNSGKVKIETGSVNNSADLDITDKDGNVLVRLEGGHIKTKYFDSSNIKTSVFPHPNVMGSPQIYLPAYDNEAKTLFGTAAEVYAAYDDLVTNYPQYFGGKTSIGKDASNTYDIYKYQLGWQERKVTNDRAGTNTNTYSDAEYKPLRLVLCSGCHANETPSLYGCWWAVKEILESNEDWALFIKSNLIIDVVPLINPWGLDNGQVDANYNGKNINRCYYTDQQAENLAMIGLLQDLKAIGLKGVIDCHNTGYADNDGYIVSKPSYPYWNYYVNLGQRVSALMNGLFNSFFGTVKNHFHVWDSSAYSGQLHDYVNNELGLLGVTFEVRQRLTSNGPIQSKVAQFTKVMAINFINAFTTYNE